MNKNLFSTALSLAAFILMLVVSGMAEAAPPTPKGHRMRPDDCKTDKYGCNPRVYKGDLEEKRQRKPERKAKKAVPPPPPKDSEVECMEHQTYCQDGLCIHYNECPQTERANPGRWSLGRKFEPKHGFEWLLQEARLMKVNVGPQRKTTFLIYLINPQNLLEKFWGEKNATVFTVVWSLLLTFVLWRGVNWLDRNNWFEAD